MHAATVNAAAVADIPKPLFGDMGLLVILGTMFFRIILGVLDLLGDFGVVLLAILGESLLVFATLMTPSASVEDRAE